MKCQFCGKHIDDIDCSCGWCTICGWKFDLKAYADMQKNEKEQSARAIIKGQCIA